MGYDITLCEGGDCPQKEYCKRFLLEVLGRQDFFGKPPFKDDGTCEHLIPVKVIAQKNVDLDILRILLDKDEIRTRSYFIGIQKEDRTTLFTRFVRAELRIRDGFLCGFDKSFNRDRIILNRKGIVNYPDPNIINEQVKFLNWFVSQPNNYIKLEDIHWYIAEREYIYDCLVENRNIKEF